MKFSDENVVERFDYDTNEYGVYLFTTVDATNTWGIWIALGELDANPTLIGTSVTQNRHYEQLEIVQNTLALFAVKQ